MSTRIAVLRFHSMRSCRTWGVEADTGSSRECGQDWDQACIVAEDGGRALGFAPGRARELPLSAGFLGHPSDAPLWGGG